MTASLIVTRHASSSMIGFFRGFLVFAALVLTAMLIVGEGFVLVNDNYDMRKYYGVDKWFMFGLLLGTWIGSMVSIAAAYALTEIARVLRYR